MPRPSQVLGLAGTNGRDTHVRFTDCFKSYYLPWFHLMPTCRLPVPRPGQVLGLVGTNGIGKSTALKVLAGKLKPNLGRFDVSVGALGRWEGIKGINAVGTPGARM